MLFIPLRQSQLLFMCKVTSAIPVWCSMKYSILSQLLNYEVTNHSVDSPYRTPFHLKETVQYLAMDKCLILISRHRYEGANLLLMLIYF